MSAFSLSVIVLSTVLTLNSTSIFFPSNLSATDSFSTLRPDAIRFYHPYFQSILRKFIIPYLADPYKMRNKKGPARGP